MRIYVRITDGHGGRTLTKYDLDDVEKSTTIYEIKEKVHKLGVKPPEQQRLIFAGRQVRDDQTVGDCNLQDESSLILVEIDKIRLEIRKFEDEYVHKKFDPSTFSTDVREYFRIDYYSTSYDQYNRPGNLVLEKKSTLEGCIKRQNERKFSFDDEYCMKSSDDVIKLMSEKFGTPQQDFECSRSTIDFMVRFFTPLEYRLFTLELERASENERMYFRDEGHEKFNAKCTRACESLFLLCLGIYKSLEKYVDLVLSKHHHHHHQNECSEKDQELLSLLDKVKKSVFFDALNLLGSGMPMPVSDVVPILKDEEILKDVKNKFRKKRKEFSEKGSTGSKCSIM